MNVATISAPNYQTRQQAAAKERAYRRSLERMGRTRPERPEYERCAALYKALAAGQIVLDAYQAIRAAPTDYKGRPLLALARADRRQVRCDRERRSISFDASPRFNSPWHNDPRYDALVENVPNAPPLAPGVPWSQGFALVPLVPPDVRPKRGQLRQWHILWEVEAWSDTALGAQPDRDPYLLRRLVGGLFVVVAEWDLTDVEQLAMRARVEA